MRTKKRILHMLAIAGCLGLLASCASLGGAGKKGTPVERGVKAWNDKAPAAARAFWNDIEDKDLKAKYLGYLASYEAGAKVLEDSLTLKPEETAKISAAYDKAYGHLSKLPSELAIPEKDTIRALPMAQTRMQTLMASGEYASAASVGKNATRLFGASDAIRALLAECEVILASRNREASIQAALEKAKAQESFDDVVAGYDAAFASYAKAEESLASDAGKNGLSKARSVAAESSRLHKKRQDVSIQREKLLRERAYYYRDRIGEEFARPPVGKKPGSLTLEEILSHEESVKANIEGVYREMRAFSARYPGALDAETLAELESQKKDLDAKIAQVVQEIQTAKEIASRGKVVMPVMIGLFNPQPGTSEEGKKSRPALFAGTAEKKSEYWWGMVSIPKGVMNDLVITVSDTRAVRIFGYNTKSGKLVDGKKIVDLVNRGYRTGNSWPVLNAGSQLASDKYFFEIQPGKTAEYSGEVVVYSSFITRMR